MPTLDPVPESVLVRRRALGRRIRDARIEAGLTQEQLGERVDLSRGTIYNIEHGLHSLRLDTLFMIADAVRVPVVELLRGV